mmetsp:Transcript_13684/g.29690  ORF Transcript_13684/g.29690 Transcript_13684/m.29690 type:complete len:90 (-) Transcript_13684:2089-2358(-)
MIRLEQVQLVEIMARSNAEAKVKEFLRKLQKIRRQIACKESTQKQTQLACTKLPQKQAQPTGLKIHQRQAQQAERMAESKDEVEVKVKK